LFRPGPLEILLIVIALLLLFGARRIPEIARSLGQALREFRKGLKDGFDSDRRDGGEGEGR
jgi:sec-independent protein translocase protein TatA